jgi:hypothetical protein
VEQPQLVDLVNSYAVGTKSLLAIATYPSDASNGGTQSFPYGYCYGKVQSQFGCSSDGSSAVAYLKRALATSSNFYKESSWDKMRLAVTVTPLLRTTYRGASCGSFEPLDYWSGGSASALDVAAYAAAKTRGFNRASFDFNVVFMPRCPTLSFSGIGWIGAPGSLINLFANDFDASVSHEIGHNLGNMYFLLVPSTHQSFLGLTYHLSTFHSHFFFSLVAHHLLPIHVTHTHIRFFSFSLSRCFLPFLLPRCEPRVSHDGGCARCQSVERQRKHLVR